MSKRAEEVEPLGRPVFYAVLYESFRRAGLECGYAVALHGSMANDMDLIAVAWTEDAKPPEVLVDAIQNCIGKTIWSEWGISEPPTLKPHGRIAYALTISGATHIDLSIIPPHGVTK